MDVPAGGVSARNRSRFFVLALVLSTALMALLAWLSTGTMAIYAVSLVTPWEMEGYIVNYDHHGYTWNWKFVTGDHAGLAVWNSVGNRLLLFVLSIPLGKLLGFFAGVIVTGIVINLVVYVVFVLFVRRTYGEVAGFVAMAMLSTYPGIFYWIGMPYAHSLIIPSILVAAMLAHKMLETRSVALLALEAFGVGLTFTAYDLAATVLPSVMLTLLLRRRFAAAAIAFLPMALPAIALPFAVHLAGYSVGAPETYLAVVRAYLHPGPPGPWWELVKSVPVTFVLNYFDGNYWVMPSCFLVLFAWGRIRLKVRLSTFELAVALALLAVFLFNNLAPPYAGGNMTMRGPLFARLYQPVFIVMVLYSARLLAFTWSQRLKCRTWMTICVAVCFALNLAIGLGPILRNQTALLAYQHFYRGTSDTSIYDNLGKYGRSPLGIPMRRAGAVR